MTKPPFELPLRLSGECIVDAEGYIIAESLTGEHIEYIVLAVNSFEPLVRIANKFLEDLESLDNVDMLTEPGEFDIAETRSVLEAINKETKQ